MRITQPVKKKSLHFDFQNKPVSTVEKEIIYNPDGDTTIATFVANAINNEGIQPQGVTVTTKGDSRIPIKNLVLIFSEVRLYPLEVSIRGYGDLNYARNLYQLKPDFYFVDTRTCRLLISINFDNIQQFILDEFGANFFEITIRNYGTTPPSSGLS